MAIAENLYGRPLGLLTDLYQLTMACGYHRAGMTQAEGVFHLFFRTLPFDGGFAVAAGLDDALRFLEELRFPQSDLDFLSTIPGNDGKPLFDESFLRALGETQCGLSVDAIPEGTVVFPNEPLLRVQGPLIQCQLVETALLTLVNFQTLVATKAARMKLAARGEPVLEFGLRRAQGIDGALTASRAAYIGGVDATSNVLAGKLFGIPVKGTHAHSWVMCFASELEAFDAYAEALPNNCIFLVDTYDTLDGVRHAIEVGHRLRARGQRLAGIRLDSGDLAWLSARARKLLDDAGFNDAVVVGSNDLDERIIESLKQQGAAINVWGVGTRLVTAYDQPALGGVYKLAAIRNPGEDWQVKIKLSERAAKTSIPGILQVRRFELDGRFVADSIYDSLAPAPATWGIVDPNDPTRRRPILNACSSTDLLTPALRSGQRVAPSPTLESIRNRRKAELAKFDPSILRFVHPHEYPVGLEQTLAERRTEMILKWRSMSAHEDGGNP